jgi:hypothetical protein
MCGPAAEVAFGVGVPREFARDRTCLVDSLAGEVVVIIQVLICAALYALTWRKLFFELCLLPRSAYEDGSIVLGMLQHQPTLLMLLLGVLPLIVFRKRISWDLIDVSMKMRNFIWIVAAVMGVTFIFSGYNYYYDQSFLLDRVVLVVLLLLIRAHPGFLFPFVVTMMAFALQIHHPLPEAMWNWPDKRMPTHLLFAFVWFVYLRIFVRTDHRLPIILAVFVAGSTYVHAGLSKLAIGPELSTWLLDNPTSNIFVSAYQNGNWLGQLSVPQVVDIAGFLSKIDLFNNGYTLVAEIGAAMMLLDRRVARLFLGACALLHVGILASSGIFFWKWIIVDIAMIWYVGSLWKWGMPLVSAGNLRALALAALTFAFAMTHFKTTGILFAWWDTRHAQFFSYEVETESGERYSLDPRYFEPYDVMFVQSRFYYILPQPVLSGTYGTTHRYPVFEALQRLGVEHLPGIYERYAINFFQSDRRYDFGRFIQRYVTAAMRRDRKEFLPSWLSVPYHFQTTFPADNYPGDSKIETVHVYFEQHFYDGTQIVDLQRTEVMAVPIGADLVNR